MYVTYSRQFKVSLYKYHCSETTVIVQDTTVKVTYHLLKFEDTYTN